MEKQASEMMGEPVHVIFKLESAQAVKKAMARGVVGGGILGGIATELIAGGEIKEASLPQGEHNGIFYVAVGDEKVGFFSMKQGLIKNSLKELLAEWPRSEVVAVKTEKGAMPTVHMVFTDGTHYQFKCARADLKSLKKAQEMLTP